MNRENVLRVADAIEQHSIPDLGFNMAVFNSAARDRFGTDCGTCSCIAGWTCAVVGDPLGGFEDARDYLGLTREQASATTYHNGNLFFPSLTSDDYWCATPSQAVAVLRHLAETGEVDWKVADEVKP